MHEIVWHQADPRKCRYRNHLVHWAPERPEPSRSPRATGHWRAARWIDHAPDPAHGQSASFSNKTDPPRTPGNDRQPKRRAVRDAVTRLRLVPVMFELDL